MNSLERENWSKERKTYIGGSDIGAIIGATKETYATPLDIYLDKTREDIAEEEISEPAYFGTLLEDIVANEYTVRTGNVTSKSDGVIRHKDYPFLAANIDRWIGNKEYILECKTAGFMMGKEWGEEGSEEIPESYYAQVAWYAAICDVPKVDIAVLIGGQKFKIYTYNADKSFQDNLIKAGIEFWQNHVEKKVPPACSTLNDVKTMWPYGVEGKVIHSNQEINEAVATLKEKRADAKVLNYEIDELKFIIQNYIQDNELLVDENDKKVAYYTIGSERFSLDKKRLETRYPKIYEDCLKKVAPTRMLLIK